MAIKEDLRRKESKSKSLATKAGKHVAKGFVKGKSIGVSPKKQPKTVPHKAKPPKPVPARPTVPTTALPTRLPSEASINARLADLAGEAETAAAKIRVLLAEHLGSPEAARLWLVTPSPQFTTTPLDAIQGGEVENVLAYLETRWGQGPAYA